MLEHNRTGYAVHQKRGGPPGPGPPGGPKGGGPPKQSWSNQQQHRQYKLHERSITNFTISLSVKIKIRDKFHLFTN